MTYVILVVEDNERNLKLLRDVLEYAGYDVRVARTADAAVEPDPPRTDRPGQDRRLARWGQERHFRRRDRGRAPGSGGRTRARRAAS